MGVSRRILLLPALLVAIWAASIHAVDTAAAVDAPVETSSLDSVLLDHDATTSDNQNHTRQPVAISSSATPPSQIQRITARASANDLGGYFVVHFMGETSDMIPVDATADELKIILEGMSTVDVVDVSARTLHHSTVPPLSLPGMEWSVTFPPPLGGVDGVAQPSMLVDTGIALPSLSASGGTLSGSSAIVTVERSVSVAVYEYDEEEEEQQQDDTPSAPTNVVVNVISDTELGVSWRSPAHRGDGIDDISSYSVQWDTDSSFGHEGVSVAASTDHDVYSYTISNLDSNKSYYVRVLAYNSNGYGDVGNAVPVDYFSEVQELTLLDSDGTASGDLTESFTLSYESGTTADLSVLSTAKDVEDALNAFTGIGLVSVSREDHSDVFDGSGQGTASFKMIFRITFLGLMDDGDLPSLVIDAANLGTISATLAATDGSSRLGSLNVQPFTTRPSGPTNVELSVVSRTELGVSWDPPVHDGGLAVQKYLVEWDETYRFDNSRVSPTNSYSNVVDGPLVRAEVVTGTSYQIKGLEEGTQYFVRVSAYNNQGYSDAVSALPSFALPVKVPLHLATSVELTVSTSEISDRLDLHWSLPTHDSRGFITELDVCGTHTGHTTDVASSYLVRWDTHPSMASSNHYEARMLTGDGAPTLCCPGDKCFVEIGAEVQSITIEAAGQGQITSGSVKVVYVGPQSRSVTVKPTSASSLLEIISQPALPTIAAGDYIRLDDQLYQVASVGIDQVTLSASYKGSQSGNEVQTYYNTAPASCFDIVNNNSAEDMKSHIGLNFDDSPFNEDIAVSRSASEDGGFSYHVTFTGPAFSQRVDELFVVSSLDPWSDASCGTVFDIDGSPSNAVTIEVTTEMDAGSLSPGTPYYVEIAAVNSAGTGPFAVTSPTTEVPRSPPGLAQDCKVYAVPNSSTSLKVEWNGVEPFYGEDPTKYKVTFYDDVGLVAAIRHVSMVDESSTYTIVQDGLIHGEQYEVVITAINSQGEGGPLWFVDVDSSDGSLVGLYQDFSQRSCFAVPTCDLWSEECIEDGDFSIKTRSTPEAPVVSVATYPSVGGPNWFTKTSLLVTFEPSLSDATSGESIDKYMVEWSTDSSFAGALAHVTADTEYLIGGLTMGTEYHVRVTAHNSGGYGDASVGLPAKPMTSPDPPHSPTLSMLPVTSHNSDEVGTSLVVDWSAPKIDTENGRPDEVGDGGDTISSYLIEWSKVSWDAYVPTVWELAVRNSALTGTDVEGSFRLSLDTSSLPTDGAEAAGMHVTANIPVSVSSAELETLLENMPNVGDVAVTSSSSPMTWRITFVSEVGNVAALQVDSHNVRDVGVEAAGDVSLSSIIEGSIPLGAAYGSELITDLDEKPSLQHVIRDLVPGQQYFVRISSGNRLGLSPRRLTAPAALAPPVQKPGMPISLFHDESPPYLRVWSDTSLLVQIGPPAYDGGAPLTYFLVEWDKSSTFDSSSDGSSLGSARTSAVASPSLCSNCITTFDVETNTFTYSGDAALQRQLIPQRKIMVYFSDDNTSYLFKIASATTAEIVVGGEHLRASSLDDMNSRGGFIGATDLSILGAEYLIQGLEPNERYYVRVSAENGEMGTGLGQLTMPTSEIPRSAPSPPISASLEVIDKHALQVEWSDARAGNPDIDSYYIEYFTKNQVVGPTFSFFGTQEIVELDSTGLGLTDGWFHLYFGDDATLALPGTVEVAPGMETVLTSEDLAPHLSRGDAIVINGMKYTVAEIGDFTSTVLPLSEPYAGASDDSAAMFTRVKSSRLAHDISAAELKVALENMHSVGQVDVLREVGDTDGYKWFVTFLTNVGPQPLLSVDTQGLIGTNPAGFLQSKLVEGVAPDNYSQVMVSDPSTTSTNLTGLDTGTDYYVRVRAVSDRGQSLPVSTLPLHASPGQVPGSPLAPRVKPLNADTLVVTYEEHADSNGSPISHYIIETSLLPTFENATTVTQTLDHKIQRITSSAHSLPWDSSSSFTLSLGDFHGDYLSSIGSSTLVRVQQGSSLAERIAGTDSLSAAIPRGDYVRIGQQKFRVCLEEDAGLPYDESTLPLCSKDDAWSVVSYDRPAIDRAPIFVLDTSLGSAKQPRLGDSTLNTINSAGSPNDVTAHLTRGDLIRVGHPDNGESFRVSTNIARAFDAETVPLATVKDASVDASISTASLKHATYEVQSISIVAKESSQSLTPSSDTNSGFRLRFGTEITQNTIEGGAKGCLKWDSDASDVKAELETLLGIDGVGVSKEDVEYEAGVTGAGVKYRITFIGDNVRGNVGALQVIDVGENGCLDADSLGGKFSQDMEPVVVAQESMSFIPLYKVQTTEEIPFDASALDVQSAIESLSVACKVDVKRAVIGNGYSWDVSFVEQRDAAALLPMSINGESMEAFVDPAISIVGLEHVAIPSIASGIPHYVRVAAVNSFGVGPFAASNPSSVEPSSQTPGLSRLVYAEPISNTEILVQWEAPEEDGGSQITHYKVEYDTSSAFNSGVNNAALGSTTVSSSDRKAISDVQFVTVKVNDDDGMTPAKYLAGTFSLSFDGQTTRQLPHDASAEMVEDALLQLCTASSGVSVSRHLHCFKDEWQNCMDPEGYTWIVTFEDVGDKHYRYSSSLGLGRHSHKLKVDGSHLQECIDVHQTTCTPSTGDAVAYVASTQETQQIVVGSSDFTVTIAGQTSDLIAIDELLLELEGKLSAIKGVGHVAVECTTCADDAIAPGETIQIKFLSLRGDVPLISVSDPAASVSETRKGLTQPVVGRSTYWKILSGLTTVNDWYIRVQAYNAIGGGALEVAWPEAIQTYTVPPSEPQRITMAHGSDETSLLVAWDAPTSSGGNPVQSFVIQYDISPAFTSNNGDALGYLTVSEADADASVGEVLIAYPNNPDLALRRRMVLSDADLITIGVIGIESELLIGGQELTVVDINEDGCGTGCLTVDSEYTGSQSSATKVYLGHSARHYNLDITDLTPGIDYFVRIAAVSGPDLRGPYSYPGYPHAPLSLAPMDVPFAIESATLAALSETELRVDFSPPPGIKPEGSRGSPLQGFVVEVAEVYDDIHPVFTLKTTADGVVSGNFKLSLGFKGGYNIDIGTSFGIEAGSKLVDTNGADLTATVLAGDLLLIADELVEVATVNADSLTLKTYHERGTYGIAVPGYRMETFIGIGRVESGDNKIVDINGQLLDTIVDSGDIIQITDSFGQDDYLEVDYVAGDEVYLTSTYDSPSTTSSMHMRQSVVVSSDATSAEMKQALESLEAVGSVEVDRLGPSPSEGYTWHITFTSETGPMDCSSLHASCLVASSDSLLGMNAEVGVTVSEAGSEDLSFDNILFSTTISEATSEVQAVELKAEAIDGFFHLSFQDSSNTVRISSNESASDMETKLQSLPSVGKVSVTREDNESGGGYIWYVTFLSNQGDLPLIEHSGVHLSGAFLEVREVTKGQGLPQYVFVPILESGHHYTARIAAINSAGQSDWTYSTPLSQLAAIPPSRPEISATSLSKSEIDVTFSPPSENGDEIDLYQIEWSGTDTFNENGYSAYLYSDTVTCGSIVLTGVSATMDETLCSNGIPRTYSIIAEAKSELGGSFDITYQGATETFQLSATVEEMQSTIQSMSPHLEEASVEERLYQGSMPYGKTWTLHYPATLESTEELVISDKMATGSNARVDVYPVLSIATTAHEDDIAGDYKIRLGDEVTPPIAMAATESDIMNELQQLVGIGKVVSVGPSSGGIGVDHSFAVMAHTADLDSFSVVPEANWRGTGARIFASGPNGQIPMHYIIHTEDAGKHNIRVSAHNSQGFGLPSPTVAVTPGNMVPGAPQGVRLGDYYHANELFLDFQPPAHDGGAPVTKYKVEWSPSSNFYTTQSDEISTRNEEQEIVLSCRSKCYGTFTLSWGGLVSEPIAADATAPEMEARVSSLLGGDAVRVSRRGQGFGYRWLSTFPNTRGNLGELVADGHWLYGGSAHVWVEEVVPGSADIYPGSFTSEVQTVYVSKLPGFTSPAAGTFRLSFEDKETSEINLSATAEEMKEALEALGTIHTVNVVRQDLTGQTGWTITFSHLIDEGGKGAGDIDLLRVADSTLSEPTATSIKVFENVKGTEPFMYRIKGLAEGQCFYSRVSAQNEVGYGPPSIITSAVPKSQPAAPMMVNASIPPGGTSLDVSWLPPPHDGGDAIAGYELEYYSAQGDLEVQKITTSSTRGINDIQTIRTAADSESISGFFTISFNGEQSDLLPWNAVADGKGGSVESALKRLSTIGDVEVNRELSSRPVQNSNGSASEWAYGYEWHVTFLGGHIGEQPLLQVEPSNNWAGDNPTLTVHRTRKGLKPMSGTFQLGFEGERTWPLPFNASENEVKTALEALEGISSVDVTRYPNAQGFNWFVTFTDGGNPTTMKVYDRMLNGPNAKARVSTIVEGGEKENYGSIELGGDVQSYTMTDLVEGVPYYIGVRAKNSEGLGLARFATPSPLAPKTSPDVPSNVVAVPLSNSEIKVSWTTPADDGGAPIEQYRIDWDVENDFENASSPGFHSFVDGDAESYIIQIDSSSTLVPRYIRLSACNGFGWSGTVEAGNSPVLPSLQNVGKVAFTARATSAIGAMLEWQPPHDGGSSISGYMIEVYQVEE